MIYARPGDTFNVVHEGATGLVGTLGIRIDNPDGTPQTARTTAGIVEILPGIYTKTLQAPSARGDYVVVWDDTVVFSADALHIEDTLPGPLVASGYALTDLASVTRKVDEDVDPDEVQALINAVSLYVWRYCGRQFKPEPGATHLWDYDGLGYCSLEPWELRTATSVTIQYLDGPATAQTAAIDYALQPRGLSREGTYLWIEFTSQLERARGGYQLAIQGDFGMSAVPDDVSQACAIAVAERIRNPEAFGERDLGPMTVTEVIEPATASGRALPPAARDLLRSYMRWA